MSLSSLSKWDIRFLELAQKYASFSKDPSTKVGAVVAVGNRTLGFGFNGFPPCIEDHPEDYEDRKTKYALVIHAETNAILDALPKGDLHGATLYTYPLAPCGECAKFIAAVGIKRVVSLIDPSKQGNPTRGMTTEEQSDKSLPVFSRAGIQLDIILWDTSEKD